MLALARTNRAVLLASSNVQVFEGKNDIGTSLLRGCFQKSLLSELKQSAYGQESRTQHAPKPIKFYFIFSFHLNGEKQRHDIH